MTLADANDQFFMTTKPTNAAPVQPPRPASATTSVTPTTEAAYVSIDVALDILNCTQRELAAHILKGKLHSKDPEDSDTLVSFRDILALRAMQRCAPRPRWVGGWNNKPARKNASVWNGEVEIPRATLAEQIAAAGDDARALEILKTVTSEVQGWRQVLTGIAAEMAGWKLTVEKHDLDWLDHAREALRQGVDGLLESISALKAGEHERLRAVLNEVAPILEEAVESAAAFQRHYMNQLRFSECLHYSGQVHVYQ